MSISTDPAFKITDNQFWYSKCSFAKHVENKQQITIRITGLGESTLQHSAQGRDGRRTKSFKFIEPADRQWWMEHRRQIVQITLLDTGCEILESEDELQTSSSGERKRKISAPHTPRSKIKTMCKGDKSNIEGSVLCIGLDIAWFGGSANNRDSQHDCLGWVNFHTNSKKISQMEFGLNRFNLPNRDPNATALLMEIEKLLLKCKDTDRVVFAIDAPIQAYERRRLPVRRPAPGKGEIERRACENYLSSKRQFIDQRAGGANGWHPNIQPGAPLAPRVQCLLEGLTQRDFQLWEEGKKHAEKLVIECFPAEAIWAMKRLGYYPENLTAKEVKAYKSKELNGQQLTAKEVRVPVENVLSAFAKSTGLPLIVEDTLDWMLKDESKPWRTPDNMYRGGKLLDDVVDTAICLATSVSYVSGGFHVWQDGSYPEDGHIIGPGDIESLLRD